jgi:hypothetical protein
MGIVFRTCLLYQGKKFLRTQKLTGVWFDWSFGRE